MTTSIAMVLLILGCALVTWIPRVLPFILVKNMKLPKIVLRWLAYIPVCILSALVIEGFFEKEDAIVTVQWMNVLVFIPTLFIALLTKSLSKTVIAGVVTMAGFRLFFGIS
ncbi:AzlD domain-containing protein [Solibacillus sp. FSL K6-4121]|uniref:AzlD domain-containing protein n=1 Tax=Solibacillus sp. FSL K6-4121 TaxID=2921505 RepID=UPI0030F7722A